VLRKKGKPDPTPARAEKRTASRFYQLKLWHALTGVYLESLDNRPDDHCGGATRTITVGRNKRGTTCSSTARGGKINRLSCGRGSRR